VIRKGSLFNMEALPPNLRDFVAVAPEWLAGCGAAAAAPAIPAPGSMLEMLPSRALSPAQVKSSLASQGNRTFHVLIKPDNLTC